MSTGRSKTPSTPKKHYFDAHTISIWAQNIVERGGSADMAIRMILGRMETGKIPHTTVLYNTALDICGHQGMLMEAARIMHQMIAKNVRPNERTISSLLNAIAQRADELPSTGDTSDDAKVALDGSRGMPGLEAFDLKDKRSAAELAFGLYLSWSGYIRNVSAFPFNNLLKVLARTKSKDLLFRIFPIGEPAPWIPKTLDTFTYSNAINACGHDFEASLGYWEEFRRTNVDQPDTMMVSSMTRSLLAELAIDRTKLTSQGVNKRKGFISDLYTLIENADPFDADAASNFLQLTVRLALYPLGMKLWTKKLLPYLQTMESFVRSKSYITRNAIVAVAELYMKLGQPNEALKMIERLRCNYGMHISTPILNAMLLACRKLGDLSQAERLFRKYMQKANADRPDHRTFVQILLCITENRIVPALDRSKKIEEISNWFRENHAEIYTRGIASRKVPSIANQIRP